MRHIGPLKCKLLKRHLKVTFIHFFRFNASPSILEGEVYIINKYNTECNHLQYHNEKLPTGFETKVEKLSQCFQYYIYIYIYYLVSVLKYHDQC